MGRWRQNGRLARLNRFLFISLRRRITRVIFREFLGRLDVDNFISFPMLFKFLWSDLYCFSNVFNKREGHELLTRTRDVRLECRGGLCCLCLYIVLCSKPVPSYPSDERKWPSRVKMRTCLVIGVVCLIDNCHFILGFGLWSFWAGSR